MSATASSLEESVAGATRVDDLSAAVCFGAVMHERHTVAHNRFVYPAAFLRLPLSDVDGLQVPLLGIERSNVFSFRQADHGARDGSPLLPWLHRILDTHGVRQVCDGEVVLQTFPRLLGYVFNPVSFWFCHDRAGQLRAVVAEVNNTFGERHAYLVAHPDHRPMLPGEQFGVDKVFHVSPFFPVSGRYQFRFDIGEGHSDVAIDYFEGDQRVLATRLRGALAPLTGGAMARWALRQPFMTLGVMWRIHLQALQLWRKRVPFFRKPEPPLERISS